jgi:hypothetical protein
VFLSKWCTECFFYFLYFRNFSLFVVTYHLLSWKGRPQSITSVDPSKWGDDAVILYDQVFFVVFCLYICISCTGRIASSRARLPCFFSPLPALGGGEPRAVARDSSPLEAGQPASHLLCVSLCDNPGALAVILCIYLPTTPAGAYKKAGWTTNKLSCISFSKSLPRGKRLSDISADSQPAPVPTSYRVADSRLDSVSTTTRDRRHRPSSSAILPHKQGEQPTSLRGHSFSLREGPSCTTRIAV